MLAVVLHLPSLEGGFRTDDYVQRSMLRGEFAVARGPLDLFNFASGEPADAEQLIDFGYLAWWSVPELRLRMWRPLSSALLASDHLLFGTRAHLHHLHSFLWLLSTIASAMLVLRRLLPAGIAALALLLFSVEEGFTVPTAWLANRNTLVALTFALLAVESHLRDPKPSATRAALTAVLTSAALLAGEYALTVLVYAFVHVLLAKDLTLRERARSLAPVALPTSAYLVLHSLVGSDIVGSGYYVSPVRDPFGFARAALTRGPVLLSDLIFGLPASFFNSGAPFKAELLALDLFTPETFRKLPDWTTWHVLIGYLALGAYIGLSRLALRRVSPEQRPGLRVLLVSALLALLPVSGSLPSDRLLLGAALGVSALGATLLLRLPVLDPAPLPKAARAGRLLLCLWVVALLGAYSAARARAGAQSFAYESQVARAWSLRAELPVERAEERDVYLVSALDFTTATNLPWVRHVHGLPLPRSYRRLCPAATAHELRRTGDAELEVFVLTSTVWGSAVPSLYRGPNAPLRAGDRFVMRGLAVEVLRTHESNPFVMRFTFDRSLDDEQLWFLHASPEGVRRIRMPPVGQSLRLPRPAFVDLGFEAPRATHEPQVASP